MCHFILSMRTLYAGALARDMTDSRPVLPRLSVPAQRSATLATAAVAVAACIWRRSTDSPKLPTPGALRGFEVRPRAGSSWTFRADAQILELRQPVRLDGQSFHTTQSRTSLGPCRTLELERQLRFGQPDLICPDGCGRTHR